MMSDGSGDLIRTKPYQIARNEYIRIALKYTYRNRTFRLMILLVAFFLVIEMVKGSTVSVIYFLALLVILVLLPVSYAWRSSTAHRNSLLFSMMRHEIDLEKITTYFENGNTHQNQLGAFVKVIKTPEGFWLYHTALNYLFLPLASFESEQDIKSLEDRLAHNGMKIVLKG
jgi:hypothetical protein